MNKLITVEQLQLNGISSDATVSLSEKINKVLSSLPTDIAWQAISKKLLNNQYSFSLHLFIFKTLFPEWPNKLESAAAWTPEPHVIETTNLFYFMSEIKINSLKNFHTWTTRYYEIFWEKMLNKLNIPFHQLPHKICDLSNGIEKPEWLKGAKLNIIESCFQAQRDKPALIYQTQSAELKIMTYAALNELSNQVANSLIKMGFNKNDNIAIAMPMNPYAIAIYLGIIKMGGVVVSIAESFSAEEIHIRLKITRAKAIFTQDIIQRDNKQFPLYQKIIVAAAPVAIVLPYLDNVNLSLRDKDIEWKYFLEENTHFDAVSCDPMAHCNILFSSGTTGTPKAIPWNHTTAIKAATDAYLHQNIQSNDIIAWPTSLGWMMGPWLVFAGLINQATIALSIHAPQSRLFGEFIQNAKVTILGVVPSLVAQWRQSKCIEGLNWDTIKLFSSSGECSNPEDMLYLMWLANYKPIIEYCGGTEIGGAYISSTVCEKNYPSLFTSATMGLDFILISETGEPTDSGEVALIPPSMGLSTELLNAEHHDIYFANMPSLARYPLLRRHGDYLRKLPHDLYCALGRVDDTMNIGGIKISSAEIERVLVGIPHVIETAAIAINLASPGPSHLVIFASVDDIKSTLQETLKANMQSRINQHLNPLFKIYDIVLINELPKTASNKIMRRTLRSQYLASI
jgi:acetyl-CoA synthetase